MSLGRQRAVGPFGVVKGGELVEQHLEFDERLGGWLLVKPALEGLVEPFNLAAGGRVVRATVLLLDPKSVQLGFEAVPSATTTGEPGRVHHAVIGQC